jgi:C_GCAxxG_C_C family probable redox protein
MNEVDQALSLFQEGYLCSQSILMSYAPQFDLNTELAARLAAPFGGGVARRGETCGAVNGALMVLGLKIGHSTAEDEDSKERTYRAVEEFISQFQERNGTIRCNELLDFDISTPEGLQSAREAQLFTTRCPKFVSDAAEIVTRLMNAPDPNTNPNIR